MIKDAERGLEAFFYTCLKAGSATCAFAGSSDTTKSLRARYDSIDAKLKKQPITVAAGQAKKFDWSALHNLVSIALHGPGLFPLLAGVLAETESGKPGQAITYAMTSVLNAAPEPLPLLTENPAFEGILAGACLDESRHVKNEKEFQAYFKAMTDAAPSVAPIFAEWRLVCSKWKIDPVNKLLDDVSGRPVKTQGKIVVLNGVGDPASSVDSARAIAARFSAGVFVKNLAAGHTSFAAASNCLFGLFYTFFVLGMMPAEGHTCGDIFAPAFGSVQIPATF